MRLGRDGYRRIMESLRDTAVHISSTIAEMGPFDVVSDGSAIPVVAIKVKVSKSAKEGTGKKIAKNTKLVLVPKLKVKGKGIKAKKSVSTARPSTMA